MPRKTTAKQVKRTRKFLQFSAALLAVSICIAIIVHFVVPDSPTDSSGIPMLAAYEGQTELKTFESEPSAFWDEMSLFGEKLCVAFESEPDPGITAEAAVIFDQTTGEVLYSHNAYERLYPASITKCMTLLVALKYGDLSSQITVEGSMLSNLDPGSSLAYIKAGDTLTLRDLLYGLMLPSGNDAANVIAYCVAGSEEAFVELMNEEAGRIGATGSHFVNAHGLTDPSHYTTAYDIYLIYNELLNYQEFLDIIEAPSYTARYTGANGPVTNEWSRGIRYFTGEYKAPNGVTPLGGKTGTTPEAGYCLSLLSTDETGDLYVSVVLKSESRPSLYENMTTLLSKIPK